MTMYFIRVTFALISVSQLYEYTSSTYQEENYYSQGRHNYGSKNNSSSNEYEREEMITKFYSRAKPQSLFSYEALTYSLHKINLKRTPRMTQQLLSEERIPLINDEDTECGKPWDPIMLQSTYKKTFSNVRTELRTPDSRSTQDPSKSQLEKAFHPSNQSILNRDHQSSIITNSFSQKSLFLNPNHQDSPFLNPDLQRSPLTPPRIPPSIETQEATTPNSNKSIFDFDRQQLKRIFRIKQTRDSNKSIFGSTRQLRRAAKIIGGQIAMRGAFPWVAAIIDSKKVR